jgi:large subunit ribosomal protein LP0
MGKNTLIRKAIRDHLAAVPAMEVLLQHIWGNIGLVFTKEDLSTTRDKLLELKVAAPAKPGSISPLDVTIPKGNTGLEPGKTSFLQALNIPSKITKGQIEITTDVTIVKFGDKVGPSESSLLTLLGIKPFSYGLTILKVYDNGNVFDPAILDITDAVIIQRFSQGVARVASLALNINFPTIASFPHLFLNAYKNLVAISIATDYTFKQTEKIKDIIANPAAYAAAAAPAAAAPAKAAPAKAEKVKEEVKEEEDDGLGGGMSLFGDD